MNEVVLITGAANGLGAELAKVYESKGYSLALIDIELKSLQVLTNEFDLSRHRICWMAGDITQPNVLTEFFERVMNHFGRIDIVYVNAGALNQQGAFFDDIECGRALMEVNFFAASETISNAVSYMRKGGKAGKVVVISSISALVASQNSGWYSASKAAISKYLDSVRLTTVQDKITITEIILGFVDTRMIHGLKHAQFLKISVSDAVDKIIKAVHSGKSNKSVPVLKNLIWYFLKVIPGKSRRVLLNFVYKRMHS